MRLKAKIIPSKKIFKKSLKKNGLYTGYLQDISGWVKLL